MFQIVYQIIDYAFFTIGKQQKSTLERAQMINDYVSHSSEMKQNFLTLESEYIHNIDRNKSIKTTLNYAVVVALILLIVITIFVYYNKKNGVSKSNI